LGITPLWAITLLLGPSFIWGLAFFWLSFYGAWLARFYGAFGLGLWGLRACRLTLYGFVFLGLPLVVTSISSSYTPALFCFVVFVV